MFRLALDAQPLSNPQRTGHAYVVQSLIDALRRRDDVEVIACSPNLKRDLRTWERFWWDQVGLPLAARRSGADVLLTTAFSVPLPIMAGMPVVALVHDLSLIRFPGNMKGISGWFLRSFVPSTFRRAKRCITVSKATADDLIELIGVSNDNISPVYLGVDPFYRPVSAREIDEVRTAFNLPERYLLAVGTIEPRKNYPFLIDAISPLCARSGIPLVVVGKRGWQCEDFEAAVRKAGSGVIETGYVTDEQKRALLSGAVALLFPSKYEGFGMPILEAMACGCPVIAANNSSLPEVVGDAGLLLPLRSEAWGDAVAKITDDAALRQKLSAVGKIRAASFTWDLTAKGVMANIAQI